MLKVEYRVRPVTRYVVTRWHEGDNCAGCDPKGEFDNADTAYSVAYALCKSEHDASGEPLDSMNFIYPQPPTEATLAPCVSVSEDGLLS